MGARQHQLAELDDPPPAEPRQVDDAAEGVQRLRGADVGGRLLAADVLLAGLQGEHEAAAAIDVGGLAGDPAGHPPQVLLAGGEQPEGGPAEVQAVAQRLALADGHVDAALAGRAQDAERERVDLGDHDGPEPTAREPVSPAGIAAPAAWAASLSAAASSTAP